jgi:uncharacterized protein (TIGR03083 family)
VGEPGRGSRLLLIERDAILPILRGLPPASFDLPTVLPGWSVRAVVSHCAAALSMTAHGDAHGWTAEDNDRDIALRRDWPPDRLLAELAGGYEAAAAVVDAAAGRLDGLALGEWVHGGDIRDALRIPDAYASVGVDIALELFAERSRLARFDVPSTRVTVAGAELRLGAGPVVAELETDAATFVRLCSGRSPDPTRYRLDGADPARYVMFG